MKINKMKKEERYNSGVSSESSHDHHDHIFGSNIYEVIKNYICQ